MALMESTRRKLRLLWGLVALQSLGCCTMPAFAQTNARRSTGSHIRPIMRKHTLSEYFQRKWFKRVEQAPNYLLPDTVSTLYARSRMHIRRGNAPQPGVFPPKHVTLEPTDRWRKSLFHRRQERATIMSGNKKANAGGQIMPHAVTANDKTAIPVQTGLPEGILAPITAP